MDEDLLTKQYDEHREHLRAVAYRMLGSSSDADDAVQETWLRVNRSDSSSIENLGGWLTTVTARVCLNMLRARKAKREEPFEPHVPDPVVQHAEAAEPEHAAVLADSVGLALLVVLETLAPAERLAFVLHDMFAVPFDEIADMVDRSPEATRQLASRARRRVQGASVPDTDLARQREVVDAFSLQRAAGTSTPLSRCSIPTSCCDRTAALHGRSPPRSFAARQPSPVAPSRSPSPARRCVLRSSTAVPVWSSSSATSRTRSWASPSSGAG